MQTIDAAPLLDYFKVRQNFYQFLQFLFFKPLSATTISELKDQGSFQGLQELNQGGEYLYQFFNRVTESELQEAEEEFNRLFLGPGMIVAPPWESVYRSKEQLLFDESTYQVRRCYHEFGLEFVRENNEPDDHITIELEFLMHVNNLCLQEADFAKLDVLLDHQIDFLDQHIRQWIPAFCAKITKNTDSLLFKGAALLLEDFIESDYESLIEIKEALANVR